MENDGVQLVWGALGDYEWYDSNGMVELDWMPPLYPHRWVIWTGTYNNAPQISISLHKLGAASSVDFWTTHVAEGSWKEMWPLFLTYVNLMNRGKE